VKHLILIAEDDLSIAELERITLATSGYDCKVATDGNIALELINEYDFSLALLDIMLPGVDGYNLLEILKDRNIPAIFVTAKINIMDKVKGLKLGAEDYITKPFEPLELLARVEVALRRLDSSSDTYIIKNIRVDCKSHNVYKDGQLVALTPKEYELLEFLLNNPNIAFSRESLLKHVWGYDFYGSTRTVDTHILNLRNKLGLADKIQTVHKMGYRLEY